MSRISGYAALATVKSDDLVLVVDVHDTSMAATGTDKKVTVANLLAGAAAGYVGLVPSGDNTGATDTTNIQGLLNLTGICILQPGLFWINQSIQMPSSSVLAGYGKGITTIRAKASFAATQVGSNSGMMMIASSGNSAQSNIVIRDLTVDMNQTNIASLPGYADAPESSPISMWSVTGLNIDNVEAINAIGYSIYVKFGTRVWVTNCRVLSGASSTFGTNQQDGIHVTDSSRCFVEDNDIDTGTGTAGDDGIAVQSYTGCSDIIVRGNIIRSAQHGVAVVMSGGNLTNIKVHDNDIWATKAEAVIGYWTSGTVGVATDLSIEGNKGGNIGTSTTGSVISVEYPFVNCTIADNSFAGFNNTSGNGFFLRNGANTTASKSLNLNNNTITGFVGGSLALIGASGCGVAGVNINGNYLDGTASASLANGIVLADSTDGTIANNTVLGVTTASSYGIQLYGGTTAPIGLSVVGNRVKGWANGIYEFNAGVQPDYNVFTGNNCHGCTAFITTSGTHDVVGNNVVA